MISISFNHLLVIVFIIGVLAYLGGLIYDHFKIEQEKTQHIKNLFANGKTPRSKKRKRK